MEKEPEDVSGTFAVFQVADSYQLTNSGRQLFPGLGTTSIPPLTNARDLGKYFLNCNAESKFWNTLWPPTSDFFLMHVTRDI